MSKKWVALLLVACVALAGGVVYVRMNADTKGPEIIISDNASLVRFNFAYLSKNFFAFSIGEIVGSSRLLQ